MARKTKQEIKADVKIGNKNKFRDVIIQNIYSKNIKVKKRKNGDKYLVIGRKRRKVNKNLSNEEILKAVKNTIEQYSKTATNQLVKSPTPVIPQTIVNPSSSATFDILRSLRSDIFETKAANKVDMDKQRQDLQTKYTADLKLLEDKIKLLEDKAAATIPTPPAPPSPPSAQSPKVNISLSRAGGGDNLTLAKPAGMNQENFAKAVRDGNIGISSGILYPSFVNADTDLIKLRAAKIESIIKNNEQVRNDLYKILYSDYPLDAKPSSEAGKARSSALINYINSINIEDEPKPEEEAEGQGGDGAYSEEESINPDALGLTNFMINKIMKGKDPSFVGTYGADQIHSIHFPKDKKEISFIANTSPYPEPGHWVAVRIKFADKNNDGTIEFYDSFGNDVDYYPEIENGVHRLVGMYDRFARPYQMKNNNVMVQSRTSDTCGFFATKFLLDRAAGKSFKEATHFDIIEKNVKEGETDIAKFREFIFRKFPAYRRFVQINGKRVPKQEYITKKNKK